MVVPTLPSCANKIPIIHSPDGYAWAVRNILMYADQGLASSGDKTLRLHINNLSANSIAAVSIYDHLTYLLVQNQMDWLPSQILELMTSHIRIP